MQMTGHLGHGMTAGFKTSQDQIEISKDERVQDSLDDPNVVTLNLKHQDTADNILKKLTESPNRDYFGAELQSTEAKAKKSLGEHSIHTEFINKADNSGVAPNE